MAGDVFFLILVCLSFRFIEANTSLDWFDFYDKKALSGHNNEGIRDINQEECARRCLVGTSTVPFGSCLSFDYDNQGGGACILSTANMDTPGANLNDGGTRFDYYHRKDPYSPCDFDSGMCQYTQDRTDNFDWTRHSGETPTGITGPTVDHTTGTGHYMYIETSNPQQREDVARLISPSYRRYPDGQCLLFWTHMYGYHPGRDDEYVGTLTVSVKVGERTSEIWTRSRNQGNQWFSVAVSIPATGSYQVIFEGEKGHQAHGDIAIDDVSILQGACPAGDVCAAEGGKGPCGQICTNNAGNFTCSCNDGYTLHQDGLSCNDVNECSEGPCAHTCTNTVGSYICSCNTGYNLNSDGHMCDRVQCPTIPAPENGAVTGDNSYQDEVQFTCNHGYLLIGDPSRTCQADGTWTGADPACIGPSDITPTSVKTKASSSTAIQLTWSLSRYADQVQGYTISVQPRGGTNVTTIGVGRSDSLYFAVQNLVPYTYYEFWVVATIGDFQSGRSKTANRRTMEGIPTVPRDVRLTNLSWSELRVTWKGPDNFYGPSIGYVIDLYSSMSSYAVKSDINVAQNHTEYRFSGLEAATSYTVEVRANNGRNTGPPGNATARTSDGFPTVPQDVRLTNLSWSELRVTWNGSDNFYGPDSGYVIDLFTSMSSDAVKSDINVAQSHTEYRFSGLEAATSYTVKVRANNGRNTGPPGNATARTSDGFPSSPTNISRQENHTHCDISWSSPVETRGDIIGYNIHIQGHYTVEDGERLEGEYKMKSTESTSIRLMKSTKTEILDLWPNSVYTINVAGFTYTGEGNYSQTVNCTVPLGKPSEPEPPELPEEKNIASTSFPLQLKPASKRNGPIGCYHVVVVKSSSTENLPDPEMLQPYKTLELAKNSGSYYIAYIAMAVPPEAIGDSTTVTVGDGTVTSCNPQQAGRKRRALTSDDVYNQNYTNSPLDPDAHYTTSVRAYGPNDGGQPYFSASQYMDPVSTDGGGSAIPSHTAGMIGLGAVSALLLIALVAAVAIIVVLKRRLASLKSKREATGTTVQNDAFDDTYYTDTRTNPANQDGTYCDVMDGRSTRRRGQADGTSQEGEYDVPDVSGEEGAYQTLDPRTLENSEYQNLRK